MMEIVRFSENPSEETLKILADYASQCFTTNLIDWIFICDQDNIIRHGMNNIGLDFKSGEMDRALNLASPLFEKLERIYGEANGPGFGYFHNVGWQSLIEEFPDNKFVVFQKGEQEVEARYFGLEVDD